MRSCVFVLTIVATTIWSGVPVTGQAPDPQLGTWVLNLAKSTFKPGPPPRSQTRTFESTDRGVKYTLDGIDANGKPTHVEYIANFDGKDYPLTGAPDSDTIALKRIDAYTLDVTLKKNGKVVFTGKRMISKDGKTATVTNKGINAEGQPIDNVLVFDKR